MTRHTVRCRVGSSEMGDGTARVMADAGGDLVLRNPLGIAVNKPVFFRDGAITGESPDLPYVRIEV